MLELRKYRAFTLIEIIIVITIVAFLSATIYGGYSRISGSYNLALGVDNLTSQVSELKNKALYSGEPYCYGIKIADNEFQKVRSKYLNPVEKCANEVESLGKLVDDKLIVSSVKLAGQNFNSELITYFLPLSADIYLTGDNNLASGSYFEITLGIGNSAKTKSVYYIPSLAKVTEKTPEKN